MPENHWASLAFQTTRRLFENPEFASHLVIVYALLLLSPGGCAGRLHGAGPGPDLN